MQRRNFKLVSLANVAGVKVKVHFTFLILLLIFLIPFFSSTINWKDTLYIFIFILLVFVLVILHELGHALMAKKFNVDTLDIVISPIGGIARLKALPKNPIHEIMIALAGPLVNLIISILLFSGLKLFDDSDFLMRDKVVMEFVNQPIGLIYLLALSSGVLFLFNLFPALPFDGGRVLRALLTLKYPRKKATFITSIIGRVLGIVFICFGIYNRMPTIIIVGLFIYTITTREYLLSNLKLG